MKKFGLLLLILCLTVSYSWADRVVSGPVAGAVGGQFEVWQGTAAKMTDADVLAKGQRIAVDNCAADGSISYTIDWLTPGTYHWYFRYAQSRYQYTNSQETANGGSTDYSIFVPLDLTRRSFDANGTVPVKLKLVQ